MDDDKKKKDPIPVDEHVLNPPPKRHRVSFITKTIFALLFLLAIGLYFYMVADRRITQKNYLLENQMQAVRLLPRKVPALTVINATTNKEGQLSEYLKGWTLLNIWATWCPPCREEMPSLEKLHQKMGQKLNIVALSIDENIDDVNSFIKSFNPHFDIVIDKKNYAEVAFGINKYPETFLISPNKDLVIQFSGPRNWANQIAINYFEQIINNEV